MNPHEKLWLAIAEYIAEDGENVSLEKWSVRATARLTNGTVREYRISPMVKAQPTRGQP